MFSNRICGTIVPEIIDEKSSYRNLNETVRDRAAIIKKKYEMLNI